MLMHKLNDFNIKTHSIVVPQLESNLSLIQNIFS